MESGSYHDRLAFETINAKSHVDIFKGKAPTPS